MTDDSAPARLGHQMLNVRQFGAAGDGQTDDTQAIQAAIDAAMARAGQVYFPPGVYACSKIRLKPHVTLTGCATWTYWYYKGSVIKLIDPAARCLFDATGAIGVVIDGLALDGLGPDGRQLGNAIHGIMVDDILPKQRPPWPFEDVAREDTLRIERSLIRNFSGDGLHLNGIWVFTIRHSMIANNLENGVYVYGYDGFILDCWLTGNHKAGYAGYTLNAAVTMTANRIEWNRLGGIIIAGGNHYNITGNYIDRSGGPAIWLQSSDDRVSKHITITGNVLHRSGAHEHEHGAIASSHIVLEGCRGVVVTGNTMSVGQDDGQQGVFTPAYGVTYRQLGECIIRDNVLFEGALQQLVRDLGDNDEASVIVRDNIGSLAQPETPA
jgi:hypothetical protein